MDSVLTEDLSSSAFAFRGYNVTNLGRIPELLEHPAYGPIMERHLNEAAEICTNATARQVDLTGRVRRREETTIDSYSEAICLVVASELAELEMLKQFFGIEFQHAQSALGYSLGEVAALVASGMYPLASLLIPILSFSDDCVELARNVEMGIVFSRGPALNLHDVEQLCTEITTRNQGTIAVSSFLSPNTVLVLGQNNSLDLFKEEVRKRFDRQIHVKKNPDQWPPIHTAIVRQRTVPDRASVMLETVPGGLTSPSIPIISCVTGKPSYNDFNSRSILYDWIDHPQQLWKVIEHILNSDVHTLIHVGPEPNIIPATRQRLSMNIAAQLNTSSLSSLGLRAVSQIVRVRPWLGNYLSKNAALLRAPLIKHVNLQDWLLEQTVK